MITKTQYIRPNITIETEIVGDEQYYVYNYQGIQYKVFDTLTDALTCANGEYIKPCREFDNEYKLNQYFQKVSLKTT